MAGRVIHRPIHISCDWCGAEREPTPGQSHETLRAALDAARSEGWMTFKNDFVRGGHDTLCTECGELRRLATRPKR